LNIFKLIKAFVDKRHFIQFFQSYACKRFFNFYRKTHETHDTHETIVNIKSYGVRSVKLSVFHTNRASHKKPSSVNVWWSRLNHDIARRVPFATTSQYGGKGERGEASFFLFSLLRTKRNPIRCLRPIMPDHNCVATTFLLPTIRSAGGRLSSQTEIETELLFPRCFRRQLPSWMLELDLK